MRFAAAFFVLLASAVPGFSALTREQKLADLVQLASIYAKNYGPYEWKRDAIGFDLMNLQPWLDRAVATKSDLEFMDLLVEYVASLNDAHDFISFPSTFYATLGLTVDIYDGKVLIDGISRILLPQSRYPFAVGDEVISVDGETAQELVARFRKYDVAANERSTSRFAAALISRRYQQTMPRAHEIGDSATVVIHRNGADETYTIPWNKSGLPILEVGPVPSPSGKASRHAAMGSEESGGWDDILPDYMRPMASHLKMRIPEAKRMVLGYGSRSPVFTMPANFQQRLGLQSSDYFFSGTYEFDGLKIGFIRVPSYEPANLSAAARQFDTEIMYFQANTDGLVIDEMRNPGGYGTYAEALLQRMIPHEFRTMGFEIRATSVWVADFADTLLLAYFAGAPDDVLAYLAAHLETIQRANRENRGRTGPIPLNSLGAMYLQPAPWAYTKPVMLLVDEMSASAADMVAAVFQDARRGPLFGYRTMGAGGNVAEFDATSYTEGYVRVTESLMSRENDVKGTGYPPAPYIENAGVLPDIVEDYMTKDNLMNGGQSFVASFSKAIAAHIRASQNP